MGLGTDPLVTLRPMERRDLDAVLAIERRAFAKPWSREFFEKELAAAQARCTVGVAPAAEGRAERIVGYTVCWRILDELHLLNVAVHQGVRGGGLGRSLIEAALDQARRSGARVVYLEVRAGNVSARRLYRRLGFREVGVRRGYYGVGQDAIVMELVLAVAA